MTTTAELRQHLYSLLDESLAWPSDELLDLLALWWIDNRTRFTRQMDARKARRILRIWWDPPVLQFTIERHPGPWEQTQGWRYDFDTNRAELISEQGVRMNPPYTGKQVERDAKRIVRAVVSGGKHTFLNNEGSLIRIWMGRIKSTRPVPYVLPGRTARGRQDRLKAKVAELMESNSEFERVPDTETRGSLCYRRV